MKLIEALKKIKDLQRKAETPVTIELNNKFVTKTIAEWIHRRKDLAKLEEAAWRKLTDRGLTPENKIKLTPTTPEQIVKNKTVL